MGPKVPGILVLGLMAAQYLIFGGNSGIEPNCTLKVDRPHYSTSLKESRNLDAIKLNITSECNVPQKSTVLQADIQTIQNNAQVTAHAFNSVSKTVTRKDSRTVKFLDLFVICTPNSPALYHGRASGEVHLANGAVLPVSGDSGEFQRENCKIGAK